MFRAWRLAGAFAGLLLLTGCLAAERNVSEATRVSSHWAAVSLFDEKSQVLLTSERAQTAKADLNILALSGGGADGAFGAGLLAGWTESGKRPQFDIVTGVSTGALMSTFAFIGPSADPLLEKFYTTTTTADVFTSRGLEGLLNDSLYDTARLKSRLVEVIDESVLATVAAEHNKGRRLYVATTNLDAGIMSVWNMGAIAASRDQDSLELYREIIRASAAVPAFFKPVLIRVGNDGGTENAQMHVDGAVKAPVLLRSFMLNGPYKHKNVYLVINSALKLRTAETSVENSLTGIARKSISELLRGLLYKTVYQTYVTTRRTNAAFNLAYIPDDVPASKNPLDFNPDEMKKLFEVGRALGRSGKAWQHEPPRLEPFERIEAPTTRKVSPPAMASARASVH